MRSYWKKSGTRADRNFGLDTSQQQRKLLTQNKDRNPPREGNAHLVAASKGAVDPQEGPDLTQGKTQRNIDSKTYGSVQRKARHRASGLNPVS